MSKKTADWAAAELKEAVRRELSGIVPSAPPEPRDEEEDRCVSQELRRYGHLHFELDLDDVLWVVDANGFDGEGSLRELGRRLMAEEPKLPKDADYYDAVVTNFRRYQNLFWKVGHENDILIHFGQSDGIKGLRNNYEFRAKDGRRQTFLGSNHEKDADTPTYEDDNLTKPYSVKEVIAIWLPLRNVPGKKK